MGKNILKPIPMFCMGRKKKRLFKKRPFGQKLLWSVNLKPS